MRRLLAEGLLLRSPLCCFRKGRFDFTLKQCVNDLDPNCIWGQWVGKSLLRNLLYVELTGPSRARVKMTLIQCNTMPQEGSVAALVRFLTHSFQLGMFVSLFQRAAL